MKGPFLVGNKFSVSELELGGVCVAVVVVAAALRREIRDVS